MRKRILKKAGTNLIRACTVGNEKNAIKAIRSRASMEIKDEEGLTPLHIAIIEGYHNLVKILLENGADCNALSESGYSPLMIAIFSREPKIATYLFNNFPCNINFNIEGYGLLHAAAAYGNLEIVEKLLGMELDINQKDKNGTGYTPVFWSVQEGHIDTVKLFLDNGCDITCKNEEDFTMLQQCAGEGYIDIAKLLVSDGADPHEVFRENSNALHTAAAYGNRDIALYFAELGVDPFLADEEGYTPISFAEMYGHDELANEIEETYKNRKQ